MVKGQIAAGGRGKAGLSGKAATREEIRAHARRIFGQVVKGKRVESVRIEHQVAAPRKPISACCSTRPRAACV